MIIKKKLYSFIKKNLNEQKRSFEYIDFHILFGSNISLIDHKYSNIVHVNDIIHIIKLRI